MPTQIEPYVDGWLGSEREITVIPVPLFPFGKNPTPDTYSRLYERRYQILPRLFLPRVTARTAWTNLLTYSEQLDNAAWTKTNLTATADQGTAPDGQTTLDKLLETVTNGEHSVTQGATVTAAATEVSVFAVGGLTRLWIRLAFIDSAATTFSAFFNIASGYTITPSAGVTAKVVALGNNQFRCVIKFTPAAGAGTFKVNVSTNGSTISYAGTTTNGVYLWGAQVTTGSETPYISTTSATRAISAPDRDRDDPLAYLLSEDDPTIETSQSGVARRIFGRIPAVQTVPAGSLFVTKPDIPGTFPQAFGTSRIFQPVSTVASFDAYTAQDVVSDSGAPASFRPSSGTCTATFAGATTAATNATAVAATWQTNLNALTPISDRGSVVVTGGPLSSADLLVTFPAYAAATVDASALTGGAGAVTTTQVGISSSGYGQSVQITRTISGNGNPAQANTLTTNTFAGYTPAPVATIGPGPFNQGTIFTFTVGGGYYFTGGSYQLTMYGQTTAAIAYNASEATIRAAILAALTNLYALGTPGITVAIFIAGGNIYTISIQIIPTAGFTGGTFDFTIFGQTASMIAYNTSIASLSTAINALTEVSERGGCTVVGTISSTLIQFNLFFSNPLIAINIASLVPAGSTAYVSDTSGVGRTQVISISSPNAIRLLYVPGHGIVAGDEIYLKYDSTYITITGNYSVPDINNITLQITPDLAYATATAITEIGKQSITAYQPGSALTRVNRVTEFYLPGVSAGITTAADIPLPEYQGSATALLEAIFAGDTSINYQVGELEQWRESPILQRTITTINATQL